MSDRPDQHEIGPSGGRQPSEIEPSAFVDALREAVRSPRMTTEDIDAVVLEAARRHFASSRQVSRRWVRVAAAASVFVCAGIATWIFNAPHRLTQSPAEESLQSPSLLAERSSTLHGDWNRDGAVNILDAFGLARSIDADDAVDLQWDVNHDGRVDARDADSIASLAVQIKELRGT